MKEAMSPPSVAVRRVVIIEDSLEDREEIRRLMLQGSDRRYQFVEADTGAAGVRAIVDAPSGSPDCVVLDFTLPDADAMDILAEVIGADGLTVCPVVVLTGTAGPQFGPAVLRAGAQDFIGKSWMTAESLTRAVENAVERWAMTRELRVRTEALKVSQEQLQLAVEVAGLGVSRIDYATNTVVLDTIAAALFGLDAHVPLSRAAIHDTFHPDDKDEIFRRMNLSFDPAGERTFSMEHRVVHFDGSVHWLSVKKKVVFAESAGVLRPMTGVLAATDITARKVGEEQLREAERQFLQTVMNVSVPTLLHADDDTILLVNQAWTDISGYRKQDIPTISDWTEKAYGERNALAKDFIRTLFAAETRTDNGEWTVTTAAGEKRVWHFSSTPAGREPGGRRLIVSTAIDITERKHSEAALRTSEIRYRRLFEAATDGVLLLDGETGRITDVNPYILEVLGSTREDVLGRELWEIGMFADATASRAAMAELQMSSYLRHDDLPLQSKTGQRREVEVVANVYFEDGHRVIQCNIRDISERKRVEKQLKEFNEHLERVVAERTTEINRRATQLQALAGQLIDVEQRERQRIAMILHDHLQQLLTANKFHVGILRKQLPQDAHGKTLKKIEVLLDESLNASRNLTVELSPPILQHGSMTEVLAWLAKWFSTKHGLSVEVQADTEGQPLPPEVRLLIFQVVREVLFNVVKHAKTDRARVELGRTSNGEVQAVVSDAGAGFDQAQSHSNYSAGSGLGLFSIRERLDWLGGTFRIESVPGQGTRATVTAPMRLRGTSDAHTPEHPGATAANTSEITGVKITQVP